MNKGESNISFKFKITKLAKTMFDDYLTTHPGALLREQKRHGITDLARNIGFYFSRELQEPEHIAVVEKIVENKNVMDVEAMSLWIKQNWFEVYMLKIGV